MRLSVPDLCAGRVQVLESFEDTAKGTMYIVMELCSGGNLIGRLKKRCGDLPRAAVTCRDLP